MLLLRMDLGTPAALRWLCRLVTALIPGSQKKKRKPKITPLLREEARTQVLEAELFTSIFHCRA